MKKLMLLAALLAMLIVAAVPAIAQVSQGDFEQETETGEIEQSFEVVNTGDNSNQCAGIQGVANTGTNQNFQGILQYANEDPEVEIEEAGNFTISPESEVACEQAVNQAAAAN
jgi:ABC-type oligopeptide transport system substrate-binding subunit